MNSAHRIALAALVLGLTVGSLGQARADLVTFYSDPSAFVAAVPSLSTLDFGSVVTNGSYEQGFPQGFTIQGDSFQGDNGYLYVRPAGDLLPDASVYGYTGGYISVSFASGTYAVGTDMTDFYGQPGTHTLDYTLADGTTSSFALTSPGGTDFLGIVSNVAISSITYWDSNDFPILDHFQVNTPEPSTLGISCIGILIGLVCASRRRSKTA